MTKPPIDPETSRPSVLASKLRVLIGKLRRRLRQQAPPGDLTWSEVAVLGHLERQGPATVSALASAENMRPQSMSAIVAQLEKAGLLSGAADPVDGRQTLWSVTVKCRQWIKQQRMTREDWLSKIISTRFTAQERRELARGIELLSRIADS